VFASIRSVDLGQRGHQRDRDAGTAHAVDAAADRDDRGRVRELGLVQRERLPSAVVTVSDSGTSPTVTEPPGTTQFAAAGFISTPTPDQPQHGTEQHQRENGGGDLLQHGTTPGYRSGLSSCDRRST
jgi:hypothetical protein